MDLLQSAKEAFVQGICSTKLVATGEFVLQSGLKSNIYFDMRALPSYPNLLEDLLVIWEAELKEKGISPHSVDYICGVATGGIAPAAAFA